MANSNINKDLKAAVKENDLGKVRSLLAAGADPNFAPSAEIAVILEQFILEDAFVEVGWIYSEITWNAAITYGHKLAIQHFMQGDCLSQGDFDNIVEVRQTNVNIIKKLLNYGANRNNQIFLTYYIKPFGDALCELVVADALRLIQITLLKNFEKRHKEFIDLRPYIRRPNYLNLSSYLNDCVREIHQIKRNEIKIYELITNKVNRRQNMLRNYLSATLRIDYGSRYPIYSDIILDKRESFLKRADLLDQLNKIQIYTKLDSEDVKGEKIILDYDSTYVITEYLSNEDLSNVIEAFDNSNECTTSTEAKRAKLE